MIEKKPNKIEELKIQKKFEIEMIKSKKTTYKKRNEKLWKRFSCLSRLSKVFRF